MKLEGTVLNIDEQIAVGTLEKPEVTTIYQCMVSLQIRILNYK